MFVVYTTHVEIQISRSMETAKIFFSFSDRGGFFGKGMVDEENGDGKRRTDGETHRNNLLKRRINDVLKSNNKPPPWPRSYNLLASRLRKEEAKARKHNQR
jgi:hypothetical protein